MHITFSDDPSSFHDFSPNLFFLSLLFSQSIFPSFPFYLFYLWKLGDDPSSSPLDLPLSLLLPSPRMPAATQCDDPEPCPKDIILPGKNKFCYQLASRYVRQFAHIQTKPQTLNPEAAACANLLTFNVRVRVRVHRVRVRFFFLHVRRSKKAHICTLI